MVKKKLRYIFQIIFRLAKKVRTESGIGNNPLSVAYAAAQLIAKHFKDLSTQRIFLIGSGDTASLVLKYLAQKGGQHFTIANRTEENAASLAARFNAKTLSITDIPQHLAHADVVISATTCPLPFITKHWIERALCERNNASMLLLDLAIPRDIEANVAELEHVKLYNIDDFESMINEGLSERKLAALRAETLIDVEMDRFVNWRQAAKADEMISQYRTQMKQLAAKEIERAERRLSQGDCTHQVLLQLSERLVNKLTHIPTMSLRQAITNPDKDLLDLINTFLTHRDHFPL